VGRENTNDTGVVHLIRIKKGHKVVFEAVIKYCLKKLLDGSNNAVSLRVTSGTFFHLHDSKLTHLLFK